MSTPDKNKPGGGKPRPWSRAGRQGRAKQTEPMRPATKAPAGRGVPPSAPPPTFGPTHPTIHLHRLMSGRLVDNVPQVVVYRSRFGHQVGIDGAGARDFALDILLTLLPLGDDKTGAVTVAGVLVRPEVWHLHEEFARVFLASVDVLPGETVRLEFPTPWLEGSLRRLADTHPQGWWRGMFACGWCGDRRWYAELRSVPGRCQVCGVREMYLAATTNDADPDTTAELSRVAYSAMREARDAEK